MCVCVCVCVAGEGVQYIISVCAAAHSRLYVEKKTIYLNSFFFPLCSLKEKTASEQNLHIVTCYPLMVIASCDIRRFVLDSCSMTVKSLKMYDSNSF